MIRELIKARFFLLVLNLGFAVLYVLAYHFRLERVQLEAASELMCVINSEWFCLAEPGRWVLGLSQLVPLICVKVDQPLNVIVTAYSMQHIGLAHLSANLSCTLGSRTNALIALSLPVVGFEMSFFDWPYSEIIYGIGIALVADSITLRAKKPSVWTAVWLLLVIGVAASHPMAYLFLVVLVGNRLIGKKLLVGAVIILVMIILYWFVAKALDMKVWNVLSGINMVKLLTINSTFGSTADFWPSEIYMEPCLALFAIVLLVANREWRKLPWLLVSSLAVLGAVYLCESLIGQWGVLYLMVFTLVSLLFILRQLETSRSPITKWIYPLFYLTFLGICLNTTIEQSNRHVIRKESIINAVLTLEDQPQSKFAIVPTMEVAEALRNKGLSVLRHESVLYSTLFGRSICIVVASNFVNDTIISQESQLKEVNRIFVDDCEALRSVKLFSCDYRFNKRYFNINPNEPYVKLNEAVLL